VKYKSFCVLLGPLGGATSVNLSTQPYNTTTHTHTHTHFALVYQQSRYLFFQERFIKSWSSSAILSTIKQHHMVVS